MPNSLMGGYFVGDIMKITLQETLRVSYITVTFSKDSKLTPENHQKWAKHLKKF